jgi:hypothetical protein
MITQPTRCCKAWNRIMKRSIKEHNYLETMDEFESHKEAKATLHEYQICDYSAHYYISSRSANMEGI